MIDAFGACNQLTCLVVGPDLNLSFIIKEEEEYSGLHKNVAN